jgi:hypothetical protein
MVVVLLMMGLYPEDRDAVGIGFEKILRQVMNNSDGRVMMPFLPMIRLAKYE